MNDQDLTKYAKLIDSAGLIRAFDGDDWVDLRLVMKAIIKELHDERARLAHSQLSLALAREEITAAEQALDAAHAEVDRLSAALRGDYVD